MREVAVLSRGTYAAAMTHTVPRAEYVVDGHLVRRLLRAQHPDLGGLRLRRIGTGWDNVVFRLGPDLCVRLPRRQLGADLLETEIRWLPTLAPVLTLPVPTPLRVGEPAAGYPWRWTVCAYVPGRPLGPGPRPGSVALQMADDLAGFLAALHVPAPPDAPLNPYRGGALAARTTRVNAALSAAPAADRARVQQAWADALAAPAHSGSPRWIHGDLHSLNVLASRGRLTGVIDFGDLCAGDPATDLAVAWMLLDAAARSRLRARLQVADDAWARGRGWALYLALLFLQHSRAAPVNRILGQRTLAEVLADQRSWPGSTSARA